MSNRKRKSILCSFLLISCIISKEIISQDVNKFNGGVSYSSNLLTIPSNTGKSIPVNSTYTPGISLQQESSEIGLGWGLGVGGAITRSVSGVPDDCNDTYYYSFKDKAPSTQRGSMYFKNGSITQGSYMKNVDVYSSKYL